MITASIFDTRDSLYSAILRLMISVIQDAEAEPAALMVPGGRTPQPLFDALASAQFTPGPGFHLGYTDERHVPDTDPESNFSLTAAMIQSMQLPMARVLRVETELPLEMAASRYHNAWNSFFEAGGVLPLALLGLGDDGHTCSLFSADQIQSLGPDSYAAPVKRNPGPDRVTATPTLLARADHIVFLAVGQEKAAVVDAMLQEDSPVTAARAVANAPRVSLWYAPEA